MATFLFYCHRTAFRVQGFVADAVIEDDQFVQVDCHACGGIHFVNPKRELADAGDRHDGP